MKEPDKESRHKRFLDKLAITAFCLFWLPIFIVLSPLFFLAWAYQRVYDM